MADLTRRPFRPAFGNPLAHPNAPRKGGGGGYTVVNAETTALVAAFTVPPDDTRLQLVDAVYTALKAGAVSGSNILAKLDALQVYAAHDEQAARVDWVLPSRVASKVNSPVFVADRGFSGDGASSYINTNFNPSGAANFAQNSCCFGLWSRSSGQSNGQSGWFAAGTGITLCARTTLDVLTSRCPQGGTTTESTSITDGTGLTVANRTGSTARQHYKNGAAQSISSGGAEVSTTVISANLRVGAITAASFDSRQYALSLAGGSLTANEHLDLYNAMLTYMQAVGAG